MKLSILTNGRICTALLLLSFTTSAMTSAQNTIVNQIEKQKRVMNAEIGVAIFDVDKQKLWHYNGNSRFPLMSTFKVLACAKLLADVEKNRQTFDTSMLITKSDLIYWSPITKHMVGKKMSLKQACSATMTMSDNTAANIVLTGIQGPKALTQFMREIGDDTTRLDRIEPQLNQALKGDKRDTTSPIAMVNSLHSLLYGNVLNQQSKAQLTQWMMDNKITGSLLRSVLPEQWSIADRSGAGGYGSRAITAVVWSEDQTPLIIAIYLTQTEATMKERNKAIAAIGESIFNFYQKNIN
ncbi:class A beta-lactamase [Thalassotalea sp. 1_MG-2023]|uniref:class A beta-lactamase n=1 Tax=Thalassotalea sp. 1_MG-2023 TaxID=3062680 RepID=UPI0026E2AC1E|nr:class A beta-lactamase [Thalassotalea sp. 1_MG-2023]MDO6427570.1 class A beta-lactamase [Thalassotalea sp. 1_MG-2023]